MRRPFPGERWREYSVPHPLDLGERGLLLSRVLARLARHPNSPNYSVPAEDRSAFENFPATFRQQLVTTDTSQAVHTASHKSFRT